ncbi:SCO4225 family membrane protein [Pseudoxanthomonas sp. LjRoot125]|uniref:SCO4225 family membrane protein n=1 Tax=Pseudoxanthomonas sp. LjRoot125 TaxID=3342258 RepID=UPI003EBC301F
MRNPLRSLAVFYAALVVLVAIWAMSVDIGFLHSSREHLFPDMLLLFLTAPTSLSIAVLTATFPKAFQSPFAQLAWMIFCGLAQAAVLFLASRLIPAHRNEA